MGNVKKVACRRFSVEKEKSLNLLKYLYKVMNMTATKVDVDVNYSKNLQKIHSDLFFFWKNEHSQIPKTCL